MTTAFSIGSNKYIIPKLRDTLRPLSEMLSDNNDRIQELILPVVRKLLCQEEVDLTELDRKLHRISMLFKSRQQGWREENNR
jgi:hypothetical protein